MSKKHGDREKIFRAYSFNLHMLIDSGILICPKLQYEETYICPLCMKQFSKEHLDTSLPVFLTLEDVPPKQLGGKPNILTCNVCNNGTGYAIDSHLVHKIDALEKQQFLPGSKFEIFMENEKHKFAAAIEIPENGGRDKMSVIINAKRNNRKNIDAFNTSLELGSESRLMNVKVRSRRTIDHDAVQSALLKIAYLAAFRQFGYMLIMNSLYDNIRMQILHPDYNLYRKQFWGIDNFSNIYFGTHLAEIPFMESIISIFPLVAEKTVTKLSTFLPLPVSTSFINNVLNNLKHLEGRHITVQRIPPDFIESLDMNLSLENLIRKRILESIGL